MNIDWKKFIEKELNEEYFIKLKNFIEHERNNGKIIFPPVEKIFNVFNTDKNKIKVVIIGQDPYHGDGQANGFCFSVNKGNKLPPSLKNIYKEIENEFGYEMNYSNGDLTSWANQGVFLINSILTVRKNEPASHREKGWEIFTDKVIAELSNDEKRKIFLLWGSFAQNKKILINDKKHCVLESAHPSPFSSYRGFFGNGHFKKVNEKLKEWGEKEINWKI